VDYTTLLNQLNEPSLKLRHLCQPTTTRDALSEIAATIAAGTELVLFDTDFGSLEIQALGYEPAELNRLITSSATVPTTLAALQRGAGGASRARIGLFTSGSTGLPKLVWQDIANLARVVRVSPRHADAT
jgi:acyl-coenzyme A synthetase/AMP-(fatty) acid ligase